MDLRFLEKMQAPSQDFSRHAGNKGKSIALESRPDACVLPGTPAIGGTGTEARERSPTQAAPAEAIGASESAFNRFMSGQTHKLSCEILVGIANIFHVSTDFLLRLTDIPYRTNYDIEALGLSAGAAENMTLPGAERRRGFPAAGSPALCETGPSNYADKVRQVAQNERRKKETWFAEFW